MPLGTFITMTFCNRLFRASATLMLSTGVATVAQAQASLSSEPAAGTPAPATPDAPQGEGDEIVVNGTYARSLAAGIETKRRAAYGVDSISSTDIGKFPTQNVAEALQLVPGVAITRPRGEGLYVSVREIGRAHV